MKAKFVTFIGILLSLIGIGLSSAQGTCPTLVLQALESMGDNCSEIGRNSACYGYDLVSAQFSEEVDDAFFSQPADTADLAIIESIETSEMSADFSQWGVAVMNLQANIPNSLPGQSVKFVLLGDVEVESAVEPASLASSVEPIEVTVINGTNIRSGPDQSFNVIGGITAGDSILIDGKNADGLWYRTVVGSRIGWVFGELLESGDELESLPVYDSARRSLMQSFFLRTGFGSPACEEAPNDTLMVQGPEGIEVDFTVNGADIRIGSTITMRIIPPGDIIEFTVIDGTLTIPGAGPNGTDLVLYENYRTTACLTEPDNLGVNGNSDDRLIGCDWTEPEYVPEPDLGGAFCALEDIPDGLLNYAIDLQCPGEEPLQIIIAPSSTPAPTDEPDDFNLCYEGNAWGDGRCNSDYWWNAGFYFGQLEAGLITEDQIPEQYNIQPTPTPTREPKEEKKKPKYCQIEGDGYYDIFVIATGNSYDFAYEDPGYPECDEDFDPYFEG